MTDKELLEIAVKAAGHTPLLWCGPKGWLCKTTDSTPHYYWNPLANDGDALRLAVKLGTSIDFANYMQVVFFDVGKFVTEDWNHSQDPYAATRRAIVRAAAAMKEKT